MQILAVIKQHGYRLEDVATMLGITKGSLSATINGSPNVKRLIEIARKIGCSPAEFFGDWYENEGKDMQRPEQTTSPNDDLPFTDGQPAEQEQTQQAQEVKAVRFAYDCPHCGHQVTVTIE